VGQVLGASQGFGGTRDNFGINLRDITTIKRNFDNFFLGTMEFIVREQSRKIEIFKDKGS